MMIQVSKNLEVAIDDLQNRGFNLELKELTQTAISDAVSA